MGIRIVALAVAALVAAVPARADDALWDALAGGGHVALMRHALAPGTGDPDDLTLGDCSTQRNLNDVGRDQARRTGAAFRAAGVTSAVVETSQWCRCRETAELLDLGPVSDNTALNSFFRDRSTRDAQTADVLARIATLGPDDPSVVMVTHFVNVAAIAGETLTSGEIVVAKPDGAGGITVLGRLGPFSE